MEKPKILLVEDDNQLREATSSYLRSDFTVMVAADGETALRLIEQNKFELILLDLGLPGMDGHRLLASIRASEVKIPMLILSGRTGVEEKLMGFSLGADDFVAKPADPRELRARIHLQIKRMNATKHSEQEFRIGPFEGSLARQSLAYWENEKRIEVNPSPQEFRLLHYFLTHIEHVISRDEILGRVWGNDRQVNDRSVDALVSKVRRKLGPYGELLESVHGEGYRFRDPEQLVAKSG